MKIMNAVVQFTEEEGGSWTLHDLKTASGHWVVWNEGRYGRASHAPVSVFVPGFEQQAQWVADRLSDWFAGMDHAYIVEGLEDGK